MSKFSTDTTVCLCCNQRITKPGKRITPELAPYAFAFLREIGLTREDMLGEHRAQMEYQLPGLLEWLEGESGCLRSSSLSACSRASFSWRCASICWKSACASLKNGARCSWLMLGVTYMMWEGEP